LYAVLDYLESKLDMKKFTNSLVRIVLLKNTARLVHDELVMSVWRPAQGQLAVSQRFVAGVSVCS